MASTIHNFNRNSTSDILSTITCTRDSTKDVIGHASQIDNNTLYNITDDTDVTLTLLNTLYPAGAIYIGTMNTCPLQMLGVGTWQLVSSGRVLQGVASGQTIGTTIEAGLPNITGNMNESINATVNGDTTNTDGCFSWVSGGYKTTTSNVSTGNSKLSFDASRSSSIYGNSDTVQPPAYLVNIWERIQ